jgi:hypothetical protein
LFALLTSRYPPEADQPPQSRRGDYVLTPIPIEPRDDRIQLLPRHARNGSRRLPSLWEHVRFYSMLGCSTLCWAALTYCNRMLRYSRSARQTTGRHGCVCMVILQPQMGRTWSGVPHRPILRPSRQTTATQTDTGPFQERVSSC